MLEFESHLSKAPVANHPKNLMKSLIHGVIARDKACAAARLRKMRGVMMRAMRASQRKTQQKQQSGAASGAGVDAPNNKENGNQLQVLFPTQKRKA